MPHAFYEFHASVASSVKNALNVPITQSLLTSCASARKRYEGILMSKDKTRNQNKKAERESLCWIKLRNLKKRRRD